MASCNLLCYAGHWHLERIGGLGSFSNPTKNSVTLKEGVMGHLLKMGYVPPCAEYSPIIRLPVEGMTCLAGTNLLGRMCTGVTMQRVSIIL